MKHCKTKSPPGWHWYDDAASLPADWDAALPAGHYLRKATLCVHEAAGLQQVHSCYVRIVQDGSLLLQAAFQVLTVIRGHADDSRWPFAQRLLWRSFLTAGKPRLLVAGHLFRHDIASLFYEEEKLSPYDAFGLYYGAIKAAQKRTRSAAALVKDVPDALVEYFRNYAPEFLPLRNDISMQMDVPDTWTDLTSYEKSLKHKYAQRFRKTRTGWDKLAIRELSTAEVATHADAIYQLYRKVTDHQPVRLGLLSPQFLPALKQHYGDQLRVWLMEEEGVPVAFASAWVYADRFDMFYIGFDYGRNAALNLYFNILYFSVEQAVAMGKKTLVLGRTALEAKARVGCRPAYLHTFLYIRNKWLRGLIARQQQGSYSGEGEWENRHPFR